MTKRLRAIPKRYRVRIEYRDPTAPVSSFYVYSAWTPSRVLTAQRKLLDKIRADYRSIEVDHEPSERNA